MAAAAPDRLDPTRYNLLCEFAVRHPTFHRAELESVLSLSDIVIGRDCDVVELPCNPRHHDCDHDGEGRAIRDEQKDKDKDKGESEGVRSKKRPRGDATSKQAPAPGQRSFLVLSFPLSAVGSRFRHDIYSSSEKDADDQTSACTKTPTPLPDVRSMLARCVLLRSVIELWGMGISVDRCADSVRRYAANSVHAAHLRQYHQTGPNSDSNGEEGGGDKSREKGDGRTWKMTVHTLGCKFDREEQNALRSQFAFLNFGGTVRMDGPDDEYILIREMSLDAKGGPLSTPERPPLAAFFGRILGGVGRNWRAGLENKYSLRNRAYLGPTSMDAELSLVMTNLARVEGSSSGCVAFDPFVGTGSILLACGLRGARCVGTDIDLRVLRGDGKPTDVISNFRQYGLPRPELIRSDNSLYHRHYRDHGPLYDAIVTDPPYGIRAGARKSGSRKEARAISDEHRGDHIAQTRPYAVSDVMADLLDVAARTLTVGGRLVYVIPSLSDDNDNDNGGPEGGFDEDTDLPRHDCLRLLYTCFQPLQHPALGRRTVTMEKVAEYDAARRGGYLAGVWVNGPESAEKCANIRDRIVEAAKRKPGYEEKVAVRREKRRATKEARKKAKREAAAAVSSGGDANERMSSRFYPVDLR